MAVRVHEDRYGSLQTAASRWRHVALGLLALLGVCIVGMTTMALRSRVTPYVVQVDRHGYEVLIGPAEEASPADQRIVIAQLGQFFREYRTVLPRNPRARRARSAGDGQGRLGLGRRHQGDHVLSRARQPPEPPPRLDRLPGERRPPDGRRHLAGRLVRASIRIGKPRRNQALQGDGERRDRAHARDGPGAPTTRSASTSSTFT